MEQIDIVIPYVNNQDKSWQAQFNKYREIAGDKDARRFRDANVFKYWFRSIALTCHFNYRIVLILANKSQCPKWLNADKIRIVYHDEFIPNNELPTFNSSVINCYIPFIKGLNNKYILYNDDMFNVKPLYAADFFKDEFPIVHYEYGRTFNPKASTWDANINKCQCIMKSIFKTGLLLNPEHGPLPHIKTLDLFWWSELSSIFYEALHNTKFRQEKNITDWIFQMAYAYMKYSIESKTTISHYYNNENITIPEKKIACYNDTERIKDFSVYKSNLQHTLQSLFPVKSIYER